MKIQGLKKLSLKQSQALLVYLIFTALFTITNCGTEIANPTQLPGGDDNRPEPTFCEQNPEHPSCQDSIDPDKTPGGNNDTDKNPGDNNTGGGSNDSGGSNNNDSSNDGTQFLKAGIWFSPYSLENSNPNLFSKMAAPAHPVSAKMCVAYIKYRKANCTENCETRIDNIGPVELKPEGSLISDKFSIPAGTYDKIVIHVHYNYDYSKPVTGCSRDYKMQVTNNFGTINVDDRQIHINFGSNNNRDNGTVTFTDATKSMEFIGQELADQLLTATSTKDIQEKLEGPTFSLPELN